MNSSWGSADNSFICVFHQASAERITPPAGPTLRSNRAGQRSVVGLPAAARLTVSGFHGTLDSCQADYAASPARGLGGEEVGRGMDLGLKGRAALVAAASRGLGRATAMSLAREGARVAIAARGQAALEEAAKEIRDATGAEVLTIRADVGAAKDIET